MALWDLHHLRRLDDMGFVDTLYGKRNTAAHDHHGHAHDHDHAAHGKVADKVTASDAVPHLDCGDECAPTS
ncbi:MAG: hypothetical protein QOC56_863 [Alphaproteobacteria bacterium]|jgi:hypothetical protein|nr:hypothetical protein [Alphaproteobacteria bacterium]